MASVSLRNLSKRFGAVVAVDSIDVEIPDGELIVFVGPSGCGKTTTLRMVAGLERVTEGEIWIGNRMVNSIHPASRNIAMVFQNFALYPHMSVFENIAFPLEVLGYSRSAKQDAVKQAAQLLQVDELLKRTPRQLSGGQQQRVALGRAVVREPSVLLMDEPLSNLDAKLRVEMRTELKKLQRKLETTTIYVTHDQVEAMTMGDRIAVMYQGVIQQLDTPHNIYHSPANLLVAGFVGSPGMNFLEGELVSRGENLEVVCKDMRFPLTARHRSKMASERMEGRAVTLGLRPEHLGLTTSGKSGDERRRIGKMTCVVREPLGSDTLYFVRSQQGVEVTVREEVEDVDLEIPEGSQVDVEVDASRLHIFHPETGHRLC